MSPRGHRLGASDEFPPGLNRVLTEDTRLAWRQITPYLPPGSYLAGGTAVAVHLRHRQSRDLDFFTTEELDVDGLYEELEHSSLPFVSDRISPRGGNMMITLGRTKIEFSNGECEPDESVETPKEVLVKFFHRRLPQVVASLSRWDIGELSPDLAMKVERLLDTEPQIEN